MTAAAKFWAVDLHVHTPASGDVDPEKYGAETPEELVAKALEAGLDAIAITDHNTTDWCERVRLAASDTDLIVLPGIELSTAEGHLIGVWPEDVNISVLNDLLVKVGITTEERGALDTAATAGFHDCSKQISDSGGLAIAAHADGKKGLLKLPVAKNIRRTLNSGFLSAAEVISVDSAKKIAARLEENRTVAVLRGSDAHSVDMLGKRRSWIKAGKPDYRGLQHALQDPTLRVRLDKPASVEHPRIESLTVSGGFLSGESIGFADDLTCLLGGTGSGKSLALELVRFVLGQQTSVHDFPQVRDEIDRRLVGAFRTDSSVELTFVDGSGRRSRIRRVFDEDGSPSAELLEGPSASTRVRAFSQSEVIEYARAPVGRMQLIDAELDLVEVESEIQVATNRLETACRDVCDLREEERALEQRVEELPKTKERVALLATRFDKNLVDEQDQWAREASRFKSADEIIEGADALLAETNAQFLLTPEVASNLDLHEQAHELVSTFIAEVESFNESILEVRANVVSKLAEIFAEWKERERQFSEKVQEALDGIGDNSEDLKSLQRRLVDLQRECAALEADESSLKDTVRPSLESAMSRMRDSASDLRAATLKRTELRRSRASDLNGLMSNSVKIRVEREVDDNEFGEQLRAISRGSRLSKPHLDKLVSESQPSKLVDTYLTGDDASIEALSKAADVPEPRIRVLFDYISSAGREREFVELQLLNLHDALAVEFMKPSSSTYVPIEDLAHGQKCTAILIIALADGACPLIIDQPEDALHAPWIEEHIVSRLRDLRGRRQFIFATRSPGLVVSADAELVVTLESEADSGRVQAHGSLERVELNELALYHLEGGPVPFRRRADKLDSALQD